MWSVIVVEAIRSAADLAHIECLAVHQGLDPPVALTVETVETVDTLRAEIVVEMEDERVHEIEDGILDEIAADGGLGRSHHYVPDLSLQAVLDHIRVAAETIITNRHSRASSRGEAAAAAVAVIAAVVDPTFREL
jgi:hypothetical protein